MMFKQLGLWTLTLATLFGSGSAAAEVTVQLRPDDTVRVTGDTDLQQVSSDALAGPFFEDVPSDDVASVTVRFPRYSPAVYVLESGEPVDLIVDGWLPSGATLKMRAWHLTEQHYVAGFEHTLGDGGWSIAPESMDALSVGHVEIQAVLTAPGLRDVEVAQRYVVLPAGTDLAEAQQWYDDPEPEFTEGDPARPLVPGVGFSTFAPTPGAQIYYVSESGSDRNDGLTEGSPLRTLKEAYKRVGDGDGDWILVRAGDTLDGGIGSFTKSGKSADEPLLIGVYGDGPRPVIHTSNEHFMFAYGSASHVTIEGLHIYPKVRGPNDAGVYWLASGENLTFEDCKIEGYQFNLAIQGLKRGAIRNLTIRRCILVDAYVNWRDGHSSGIYVQNTDGVLVDECTFDHNGWRPGAKGASRTKFNHNIYGQKDCTDFKVYRSIFARGSSHGVQNRGGGDMVDNLFYRNALAFFVRRGPALVKDNVVLESDDMGSGSGNVRGYGIEILPIERAVVENNIVAHQRGSASWVSGIEVKWESEGKDEAFLVELRDNVVYNWPNSNGKLINVTTGKAKIVADTGNVGDARSGGSASTRFVDPSRSLDTYLPGGFEEFIQGARDRERGEWDPRYGAASFNAWMREGFKVRGGGA